MRKYQTDYRLWARYFVWFFLPPWLLLAAINSAEYLWRLTGHDGHSLGRLLAWMGKATVVLGIGAGLVGWLLHAVAIMGGYRRPTPQPDPVAADYDDKPTRPAG
jgi:hypothetical protein